MSNSDDLIEPNNAHDGVDSDELLEPAHGRQPRRRAVRPAVATGIHTLVAVFGDTESGIPVAHRHRDNIRTLCSEHGDYPPQPSQVCLLGLVIMHWALTPMRQHLEFPTSALRHSRNRYHGAWDADCEYIVDDRVALDVGVPFERGLLAQGVNRWTALRAAIRGCQQLCDFESAFQMRTMDITVMPCDQAFLVLRGVVSIAHWVPVGGRHREGHFRCSRGRGRSTSKRSRSRSQKTTSTSTATPPLTSR